MVLTSKMIQRILVPGMVVGLMLGLRLPAGAVASLGVEAPSYGADLAKQGVCNTLRKGINKSLKDLSDGRRLVLYFWSAKDPKCGAELAALAEFRKKHLTEMRLVAVACPAAGDEKNTVSRQASAAQKTLNILFDDQAKLGGAFGSDGKPETRSAFIIDDKGILTRARVAKDREEDLTAWLECAIMPGPVSVVDVAECEQQCEITAAVKLGLMGVADGAHFRPDEPVLARDFMLYLKNALAMSGIDAGNLYKPDTPDKPITRQQAAKLLVASVLTKEEIEQIGKLCGGAELYLSDFPDAGETSQWAEAYVAAAVYKGWMPDRLKLGPKKDATRAYVAAMIARIFPPPGSYTGLAVKVTAPDFKRAQSLQVVVEVAGSAPEVIFPNPRHCPPFAFLQAPGMISYFPTVEEASSRVGAKPLVVESGNLRKAENGSDQIVLSAEDAKAIQDADAQGLFLRSWHVAIIANTTP